MTVTPNQLIEQLQKLISRHPECADQPIELSSDKIELAAFEYGLWVHNIDLKKSTNSEGYKVIIYLT